MALRHTFAGLMQGAEPFLSSLRISRREYPLRLTATQRDKLRIVGYAGKDKGKGHFDVSGAYATAFEDADGRVVKITTDPSDMFAHWVAQGHPRTVPIHGMYIIKTAKMQFFVIITDYIEDLPPAPVRFSMLSVGDLDALDYRMILPQAADSFTVVDSDAGDPDFEFDSQAYAELNDNCAGDIMAYIPERVVMTAEQKKRLATLRRKSTAFCKKAGLEIAEMAKFLARRGVVLRDLHRENFGMKKNGEWVVRDMGASTTYKDTPAPELKGLYLANFRGLR
jgi:hypothetical protein